MLETPKERVELLKAGINGKTIERLYLIYNGFRIVSSPILFDILEFNIEENRDTSIIRNMAPNKEQCAICRAA